MGRLLTQIPDRVLQQAVGNSRKEANVVPVLIEIT